MSFTQEWADCINRHTRQLDKLEAGLTAAQIKDVRRLTDALFARIKRGEATMVDLGTPILARLEAAEARIAELEALLGLATRDKTLRVGVVDSKPAARVV